MLIVMNKSVHEGLSSQPLQTNYKQIKTAVTFLTGFNGIFVITNKKKKFYFTASIIDDSFSPITIAGGANEIESLNNEFKGIIIEEAYFLATVYPCTIKSKFLNLWNYYRNFIKYYW